MAQESISGIRQSARNHEECAVPGGYSGISSIRPSGELNSLVNNLSLADPTVKPQQSHKRLGAEISPHSKRTKSTHGNDVALPFASRTSNRSLSQEQPSALANFVQASNPPAVTVEDDSTESERLDPEPTLFLQPETRRITQEQLVNEVKGIYAGLVMVEKKCVEITQACAKSANRFSNEQWQALIALHRTLLHEHHDFFRTSQHPTASPAMHRLAQKYAMPARMWRHGIHSFLELLRQQLPDSLEHMLGFVYIAYSMTALLMDSVPSFLETWTECLGDLARYRMAIEEADARDREIWSDVARAWYNQAADRHPFSGRVQQHSGKHRRLGAGWRLHGSYDSLSPREHTFGYDDLLEQSVNTHNHLSDSYGIVHKPPRQHEALPRDGPPMREPDGSHHSTSQGKGSTPDDPSTAAAPASEYSRDHMLDKAIRLIHNRLRGMEMFWTTSMVSSFIFLASATPLDPKSAGTQATTPDTHANLFDDYLRWLMENSLKLVLFSGATLFARGLACKSEHSNIIKLVHSSMATFLTFLQQPRKELPWPEIFYSIFNVSDYGYNTVDYRGSHAAELIFAIIFSALWVDFALTKYLGSLHGGGAAGEDASVAAWTPDYRTNFPLSLLIALMIIPRLFGLGLWLHRRMIAGHRQLATLDREDV